MGSEGRGREKKRRGEDGKEREDRGGEARGEESGRI